MKCCSYRNLNLVPEKICQFFIWKQEDIFQPSLSTLKLAPDESASDNRHAGDCLTLNLP